MLRLRCSPTVFVAAFFIVLLNASLVDSTCFYPNGDTSSDLPCDPSSSASVCCSEGFYCLSNGLCQDPRYDNPLRLQRGACSDNSWPSPGCPGFCKSEYPEGDAAVQYCDNGKYCCGGDAECCNESEVLTLGDPSIYATAMKGGDPNMKTTQAPARTDASSSADAPKSTTVQVQTSAADTKPSTSAKNEDPGTTAAATANAASASSKASGPSATPSLSQTSDSGRSSSSPPPKSTSGPDDSSITSSVRTASTTPSSKTTTKDPKQATVTVFTSTTSISSPNSPPKSKNTTAIAIGVGVGGGILLLALAILIFWLTRRSTQRRAGQQRLEEMDGNARAEIDEGSNEGRLSILTRWLRVKRSRRRRTRVFELSADTTPVELHGDKGIELSADTNPVELDGDKGIERGELSGGKVDESLYSGPVPHLDGWRLDSKTG